MVLKDWLFLQAMIQRSDLEQVKNNLIAWKQSVQVIFYLPGARDFSLAQQVSDGCAKSGSLYIDESSDLWATVHQMEADGLAERSEENGWTLTPRCLSSVVPARKLIEPFLICDVRPKEFELCTDFELSCLCYCRQGGRCVCCPTEFGADVL